MWQLYFPCHGDYLIRFWINSVGNCYFGKFSLKNLDVFFFKVKHCFGHIWGMVGPIDVKQKGSAHAWPWPSSFKVRVWNSFTSGMARPIDMELKGCESSIHDHDLTNVTMVGWADVPDSDRGDFRRQHAVDISSFVNAPSQWEVVLQCTLSLAGRIYKMIPVLHTKTQFTLLL